MSDFDPEEFLANDESGIRSKSAEDDSFEGALDRISKKYGYDREKLRNFGLALGYSPEVNTSGENKRDLTAFSVGDAALATGGSVVQEGLMGGFPAYAFKAYQTLKGDSNARKALDEVATEVYKRKPGMAVATEVAASGNRLLWPLAEIEKARAAGAIKPIAARALQGTMLIGDSAATGAAHAPEGKELDAALYGGGIQAGLEGLGVLGSGVAKYGPPVAKKIGGAIFGPKSEVATEYLRNPEAINKAPARGEITDEIDRLTQGIKDKAAERTIESGKAKDLAQTKLQAARDAYKESARDLGENLKRAAPEAYADDIMRAFDEAQTIISDGSSRAFDALIKKDKGYAPATLKGRVGHVLKKFEVNGVYPQAGEDGQAVRVLNKIYEDIGRFGGESGKMPIKAADVKRIVQNLDSISKAAYGDDAGMIAPKTAKAVAEVRELFDVLLKKDADYKRIMAEIAPQVDVLGRITKVMPTRAATINKLNALGNEKSGQSIETMRLFSDFDEKFGTDFFDRLTPYETMQNITRNPKALRNMRLGLPEYAKLSEAEKAAQASIDADAVAKLEAQKELARISKIGKDSTENISLGKIRKEPKKQLEALGATVGRDFVSDIENRRILDAFDKTSVNGSRRTTPLTIIGKSIGAGVGGLAGLPFGGAGAVMGGAAGYGAASMLDYYGPAIYKKILDRVVSYRSSTLGRFIPILSDAAARGARNLTITHLMLMQKYPEYAQAVDDISEETPSGEVGFDPNSFLAK